MKKVLFTGIAVLLLAVLITTSACKEVITITTSVTNPAGQQTSTPVLPGTIGTRYIEPEVLNIKSLTAAELKNMVDKGTDLLIIDVRDAGNYSIEHIARAINIEFNLFADPGARYNYLVSLPYQKPLIFYTESADDENKAYAMVEELLGLGGFTEEYCYVLKDGIAAWDKAGYPTAAGLYLEENDNP